jgi:hypothetical protein
LFAVPHVFLLFYLMGAFGFSMGKEPVALKERPWYTTTNRARAYQLAALLGKLRMGSQRRNEAKQSG